MTTFEARSMSSSSWRTIELAPKDPILGVTEVFLTDPSPSKVNVEVTMRSPEKFGENFSGEWESAYDNTDKTVFHYFTTTDYTILAIVSPFTEATEVFADTLLVLMWVISTRFPTNTLIWREFLWTVGSPEKFGENFSGVKGRPEKFTVGGLGK
ncbi:unnamed protein product [Camellia sinensis]